MALTVGILAACVTSSHTTAGKGLHSTSNPNDLVSVRIPASTSMIYDAFDATLNGTSGDRKFSIAIQNNVGMVTQGNRTTQVVVSKQISWSPRTLYAIIGTDTEAILMGWVYCQGGLLTTLWLEDTTGTTGFTSSTVTGTCSVSNTGVNVPFKTANTLVSVRLPPSYPTIDGGTKLSLQPNVVGSVTLNNQPYSLIPFAIVDCSNCGSSVNGGWVEVHSVISSKKANNVCLGIFYLPVIHTPSISLEYVNCFSYNVSRQTFSATYTIPSNLKSLQLLSNVPPIGATPPLPFQGLRAKLS
ncbi:hypothetical protein VFPPC_11458 [Pochonia chlamydosporia 170]|uniref:Uncharacterized protein n=1 Tax=Pochonia chlamydosporia 170 TaxID=1380566 RepID=A0A179EX38_METCM|nr:hypothetical protein VFPPC_11458 [Pochonia chlamydosporia 170]OAQ57712.1 hypothetical protein VFPPC_11458 [Pochonia chlamydosporia 170]